MNSTLMKAKLIEGFELFGRHDFENAARRFMEVISIGEESNFQSDPELKDMLATGHFQLGECYRATGVFPGAQREYKRAIDLDIDLPLPYIFLAEFAEGQGQYKEAIMLLEKCLKLEFPQDLKSHIPNVHYNLANHYDEIGDHDSAISHIERTLEIFPADEDAIYNLWYYAKKGDRNEKAIAAAKRYLEIYPNGKKSEVLRKWLSRP